MIYILGILFILQTIFCFGETALDWNAKIYHRNAKRQNSVALHVLEKYHFKPDAQILDIGCGSGKITHEIAQQAFHGAVLGIDISPAMIAFAQEEYAEIQNLSFMQKDVINLAYENHFDYIVSFFCLHWIHNKKNALQQIVRALKPKGTLLLLVTTDDEQPLLQSYAAIMDQPKWKKYFNNYELSIYPVNPEDCAKTLNQLGCSFISFKRTKKFNHFSCKTQFKTHLEALPLAIDSIAPMAEMAKSHDRLESGKHFGKLVLTI